MKYTMLHSRRARYGGVTLSLIVTLVAALVLLNVIFSTLAKHFSWYVDMTEDKLYTVSDLCHELLTELLADAKEKEGKTPKIEILFCEDYRQYEKGQVGYYLYNTAHELSLLFPDVIELDWFDCWTDPSRAKELGVTASTQVVLRMGEEHARVITQKECFVFEGADTTSPVGYDGERVFATSIAAFLQGERPTAYLTVNHDEAYADASLIYALRDAGYGVGFLDMYYDAIPEDCALLVVFAPNSDMIVADGVSERSELDALRAYMDRGGKAMVFLSANSPVMPNLEEFLAEWDVTVGRYDDAETGRSYNAMVKDPSAALTGDGFTFLAEYVTQGKGAEITAELQALKYVPRVVFRDATVLLPSGTAAEGRVRADLFCASAAGRAMSGGKQLSFDVATLPLMSLTTEQSSGAALLVCASTAYASADHLQSAVFGNGDVLLCVAREMGLENTLIGLRYKPFASTSIQTITTTQMLRWTLSLTLIPATLVSVAGIIVLVRRKYS